MISAFLASLLLAPAAQVPPPDDNGAEASEAANGEANGVEDYSAGEALNALEAADEAAEAAAEQAKEAADEAAEAATEQVEDAADQVSEAAEQAGEAANEGDDGQVCTRRQQSDMLGRQRMRKVCRPR